MYQQRTNNRSYGQKRASGNNGYGRNAQRNFSGGRNRFAKRIDASLFVKKATVTKDSSSDATPITQTLFSDYAISDRLKRNIAAHGYKHPTPIQERAIPHVLAHKDVIGVANTGTGKTAAFLIPLIDKVDKDRNERVLIVTPTRELALQIVDEFTIFARGMNLEVALCIGGANMYRQTKKLERNPQIVVGTPGRLKDLIDRKKIPLSLFRNIVLDEVDRMVDIGFIRDIQYIVSLLPAKRQSVFFSATVSGKTQEILKQFVTDAVTVSVKQQDTSENVDQDIIRVNNASTKLDTLHDLLAQESFEKVLIFGQTKWGIEKLTKALLTRGFKAAAIHGNKSQGQRQRALQQFKTDQLQILLATDVASRGLDIDNVTHVINFDQPATYEDYVHRIGRTGRAGKKGTALTFVE